MQIYYIYKEYIYIYIYILYTKNAIYILLVSEPPGLGGSDSKECPFNAGGLHSISGLRRSPGEGNGYPLQYSCLENLKDRRDQRATVHGVTKSQPQLSD